MDCYNWGIVTYHVSVHRGESGVTNLRRTGAGLKMLGSASPDPCTAVDRPYRLEILKIGESYQFFVDGRLIHAYVDAEVYGPRPIEGHFGIRMFPGRASPGMETFYDQVSVHLVKAEE